MPPAKPSFMERVAFSEGQRPGTASSRILTIPSVLKPVDEETTPVPSPRPDTFVPPPPLPLVLQSAPHPPLRKKKSFARVSHWLFPSPEHSSSSRSLSLDSITNTPKPITSRDGFYQCIELRQHYQMQQDQQRTDRSSFTSATTVTSTESELDVDYPHAPTTAATPASSPGGCKRDQTTIRTLSFDYSERGDESIELTRIRTFGDDDDLDSEKTWRIEPTPEGNIRQSRVGMAF